jgi:hypothetical protein
MEIFSIDCHNEGLPDPRFREIWEDLNDAQEDCLLLIGAAKSTDSLENIYYRIKSVKYEEYG